MKRKNEFLLMGWLALSLVAAAAAAAGTEEGVEVFAESVPADADRISASFQVSSSSPGAGKPWIEISVHAPPPGAQDNAGENLIFKEAIAGLKYEPAKREIVLDRNGQGPIVCARLVKKRFLLISRDVIEDTGNCKLSANLALHGQDHGFEISPTVVGEVRLFVSE